MLNYYTYSLKEHGDERGRLVAMEAGNNVPFDIKRVYYIYDTKKDVPRGFHAHKDLEQVLICMSGSCTIKCDDGVHSHEFMLKNPDAALYIGKNVWREMYDFSHGCVLLVLASEYYRADEYIRSYEEFKRTLNG